MLQFLPAPLQGIVLLTALAINTIICSLLLYLVALLRLIPLRGWPILCGRLANGVIRCWVGFNSRGIDLAGLIRWDVRGLEALRTDAWYLLVANHQSMIDIAVLQSVFHRKVPPLKFFLKKELFWVPFLGLSWWILDFPFMKRTSSPRKDMETARTACDKFTLLPVTIMNFVEGTRFTEAKRQAEKSPYNHLLKPKPGGMGVVLSTLGRQIDAILDVTIVYPAGIPGLWSFLSRRSTPVSVRVNRIPVTPELLGDYLSDRTYRRRFKDWLDTVWGQKDGVIDEIENFSTSSVKH